MPDLNFKKTGCHQKSKLLRIIAPFLFAIGSTGCDMFDFTPYDIDTKVTNLNAKNYKRINDLPNASADSFNFVVIGDPHRAYDKLQEVVLHVNTLDNIDFAIFAGDVTKFGLQKEYNWLYKVLQMLDIPYVVMLGNHDCQSNGKIIFRQMFGPFDDVFTYKHAKFVIGNNNGWEFEAGVPNYSFLDTALQSEPPHTQLIYLSHVPIFGDQLSTKDEAELRKRINKAGVKLAIAGHTHIHSYEKRYPEDDVYYLMADNAVDLNYPLVEINGSDIQISRIWVHEL